MTRAGVLCRNSDRHGRAFAPGFRLGAPPRSRGFRSARAVNPGWLAPQSPGARIGKPEQKTDSEGRGFGPGSLLRPRSLLPRVLPTLQKTTSLWVKHRWRGESAPGIALRTAHRPGCYPPPLCVPDTVHGRHHHSRRTAPSRRHFSATRWSSGAHGFEAALEEPARCSFSPAIHPALQCPGPAKRPPLLFLTSRSSQAG